MKSTKEQSLMCSGNKALPGHRMIEPTLFSVRGKRKAMKRGPPGNKLVAEVKILGLEIARTK
jgi:hypothetical protein